MLVYKNMFLLITGTLIGLACTAHHIPSDMAVISDYSKASTDGPHVFYRGNKVVVKSVVMEDSLAVARKSVYRQKSDVLLTCLVPETGDAFSFGLADSTYSYPTEYVVLPEKILVLSDIEGNFLGFKTMLLGTKVMDEQFNWTFGNGHLVLLGDYFDRGMNVTECLWLAYKLEMEARAAGGMVHFILGNHEVMNMSGDIRYVRNKYFENAELINEEYEKWYAPDTELGRWLRAKNAVEKIGDFIFCHGGISPQLATSRMSLADINRIASRWYGKPEKNIIDPDAALIFNSTYGIFWYRDLAKNKAELSDVNFALGRYNAKRMVLGHTLTPDLKALYNGKIICIDLQHEENLRQGFMKTLWIEKGLSYGLDSRGKKTSIFSIAFPPKKAENEKE
jgi:hypothetical protein